MASSSSRELAGAFAPRREHGHFVARSDRQLRRGARGISSRKIERRRLRRAAKVRKLSLLVDSLVAVQYEGAVGGVITVKSEMGEPIHKLATRGVLLWAELDRDFFQVEPKERRVTLIEQRKHYLIERINADGRRAEALLWRRRQGRAVRPRE